LISHATKLGVRAVATQRPSTTRAPTRASTTTSAADREGRQSQSAADHLRLGSQSRREVFDCTAGAPVGDFTTTSSASRTATAISSRSPSAAAASRSGGDRRHRCVATGLPARRRPQRHVGLGQHPFTPPCLSCIAISPMKRARRASRRSILSRIAASSGFLRRAEGHHGACHRRYRLAHRPPAGGASVGADQATWKPGWRRWVSAKMRRNRISVGYSKILMLSPSKHGYTFVACDPLSFDGSG